MIKVWILMIFMQSTNGYAGGGLLIDNIASQSECVRIQSQIPDSLKRWAYCSEVWKIK